MITPSTTLHDVSGAVAAALRAIGYDPVVVGGSASTLHAPEAYRSDDIDMVIVGGVEKTAPLVKAMATLGFSLKNDMFVHRSNPYTVEFVPSPVAIANDVLHDFAQIETTFGPVRVLHAADAVCDRLNKYIVWSDPDSLDVAIAVARSCYVDLSRIEAFINRHAVGIDADLYLSGYRRFLRELTPAERTISQYGFTTAVRLRFIDPPNDEMARAVMARIQSMLDEERAAIDGLDAVVIRGVPSIEAGEAAHVLLPLSLRTIHDLPFIDRLRVAIDVIDHIIARRDRFPEVLDILDDEAPPIATAEL